MPIVSCPVCKGWSTEKLPIDSHYKVCPHCKGESMQLKQDNYILFWDLPSQFDYAGRAKAARARTIMIIGLICGFIFLILLLLILGNQAVKLL
jgi:hypothetical protein